ncbi:MAG: hypothetical protein A2W21_10675 [Betaproteobacteria bacterium RBG_16_66_20]|nr:MAG: hypothetical protein A2W21_10675 [Betaproteobacteria bacterium RBG_16_66_20]
MSGCSPELLRNFSWWFSQSLGQLQRHGARVVTVLRPAWLVQNYMHLGQRRRDLAHAVGKDAFDLRFRI